MRRVLVMQLCRIRLGDSVQGQCAAFGQPQFALLFLVRACMIDTSGARLAQLSVHRLCLLFTCTAPTPIPVLIPGTWWIGT